MTPLANSKRTAISFLLIVTQLLFACAIALAATGFITGAPAHATGACASGASGPCITWPAFDLANGTYIYGGPAGTPVTITGAGFSAAEGQSITIGVVPNNGTTPLCSQKHIATGATAVVSSGDFTASFVWPSGLTVGHWFACAYLASSGAPAGGANGNYDNADFIYTSSQIPTVSVSPTSVLPGSVVTVTGKGWLPDTNPANVYIATCKTCTPIATYSKADPYSGGGSFTVQLTIPSSAALSSYLVWGVGIGIPVETSSSGPHLNVVSSQAPTPTPKPQSHPTATPKPGVSSPTATLTPQTTVTETTSAATSTPPPTSMAATGATPISGGGSSWLFVGLALVVVLLGGGGGVFFWLRRRSMTQS